MIEDAKSLGVLGWLKAVVATIPQYIGPLLMFSVVANLLLLVSPFYMLQVYDRILTSGSIDTLIWLTIISIFLLGIYAAAETGRRRLATLAAKRIDDILSENAFVNFAKEPGAGRTLSTSLRQMARIKGYFSNQSVLPFFDLPFAPLFLGVLFIIHPLIGVIGLLGMVLMIVIAVWSEASTRSTHDRATQLDSEAFELALGLSRQRSAIVSMGLTRGALERWRTVKQTAQMSSLHGGKREIAFASSAKSVRQMLQILVLGAGGALAVRQQVSPGAIVAGSIILGRALAPIDQIVGGWRGIASVRQAWRELGIDAFSIEKADPATPLPKPDAVLTLDRLAVSPPGSDVALVRPFRITLTGGDMIVLLGPIGTGKSTMLQTIAGAWPPFSGQVTLGGRNLHAWDSEDRGPHIGYVPQNVELLPGTVAQNIARMESFEPEDIFKAAQRSGAHEMILGLSKGYDTPVGTAGIDSLSSGQTQLIGLSRALYGEPVLIILDEPTANLDQEVGTKLIASLRAAADSGSIVIVATHDTRLVETSKAVLAIRDGGIVSADAQRYLESLRSPAQVTPHPVISDKEQA